LAEHCKKLSLFVVWVPLKVIWENEERVNFGNTIAEILTKSMRE